MLFCLILYSYGIGIYFKLFHKSPYFVFCNIWLTIIPLNTLFIYVISRIRLFRWSLHSVWYVISESFLLILYMYFYDRIAIMYFPKFRFYALCEISVFIAIQLVFVLVASICRNRMIKNKQKQKDV